MEQTTNPDSPGVSVSELLSNARSWLGTRFRHQGRVKKSPSYPGAVDCVGLLLGVAKESGLPCSAYEDKRDYPPTPDGLRLRRTLEAFLTPYPEASELIPGLVLLFHAQGDARPSHVGIIGNYKPGGLSLIHAYIEAWSVVEHRLDFDWQALIVSAYKFPGVAY